jgi:hypothetical protein
MQISKEVVDSLENCLGSHSSALSAPFQALHPPDQESCCYYGVYSPFSWMQRVITSVLNNDTTYDIWSRMVKNRFNFEKQSKKQPSKWRDI